MYHVIGQLSSWNVISRWEALQPTESSLQQQISVISYYHPEDLF
jgi:hypothetical protein